jgi:hypothetical protein
MDAPIVFACIGQHEDREREKVHMLRERTCIERLKEREICISYLRELKQQMGRVS